MNVSNASALLCCPLHSSRNSVCSQSLIRHPKRPDELRIEQLKEPWEEGGLASTLALRSLAAGTKDFDTACAFLPPSLFNKDPEYETSVFVTGAHTSNWADDTSVRCDGSCPFPVRSSRTRLARPVLSLQV
jgi:hypothetical protein